MIHIPIKYISVKYPIGVDMRNIRMLVAEYIREFNRFNYAEGTCFNLWCRGSSGAILASTFALLLPQYEFTICHIKKPREYSHSCGYCTVTNGISIVIDDFVSSGSTINAILDKIMFYKHEPYMLFVASGAKNMDFSEKFTYIISNS